MAVPKKKISNFKKKKIITKVNIEKKNLKVSNRFVEKLQKSNIKSFSPIKDFVLKKNFLIDEKSIIDLKQKKNELNSPIR